MSIARRTEKNAKVRKDLNNIPACGARAINFYRHSGPKGPEEGMPLHPEPLSKRAYGGWATPVGALCKRASTFARLETAPTVFVG